MIEKTCPRLNIPQNHFDHADYTHSASQWHKARNSQCANQGYKEQSIDLRSDMSSQGYKEHSKCQYTHAKRYRVGPLKHKDLLMTGGERFSFLFIESVLHNIKSPLSILCPVCNGAECHMILIFIPYVFFLISRNGVFLISNITVVTI